MVNFNTRNENLLDLILTDDELSVVTVGSHPPIGHSDHSVIEFSLGINSGVTSVSSVTDCKACNFL